MVKTMAAHFDLFFGKVDKRPGITSDPSVSILDRLGTASYYVSTRQNGLTSTENILIKNAKEALEKALETINSFFENEWNEFQSRIETLDLTPFKEIETIRLDN